MTQVTRAHGSAGTTGGHSGHSNYPPGHYPPNKADTLRHLVVTPRAANGSHRVRVVYYPEPEPIYPPAGYPGSSAPYHGGHGGHGVGHGVGGYGVGHGFGGKHGKHGKQGRNGKHGKHGTHVILRL
ncbi:hypothetical protein MKX03_029859 [Papaver bracteatum]|nr:hypothetical protein MKX03_029859 [Papaver bracteatum]